MNDLSAYHLTVEDLPEWMRPQEHRRDWGLLVVVLVILVVAGPLILEQGIPDTLSAQLEMQRIWAIHEGMSDGSLYPRWNSYFNGGYGSPVFNYLAPLPHYLGGLHSLLFQTGPQASWCFVILLGIAIGGLGTFFFVRRRWGQWAGVLASITFLLSPYGLHIGTYATTDSGVFLATVVFPWVLWAIDSIMITGRGRDVAQLALITAVLGLSDNTVGPILIGLAGGWLLLQSSHPDYRRFAWRAGGAMLLGVFMISFYTLPWLSESDAVRWQTMDGIPALPVPDIRSLFAIFPHPQADHPALYFGLAVWLLGGLAFIWLTRAILHGERDVDLIFFAGLAMLLVILTVGASERSLWSVSSRFDPLYIQDLFGLLILCIAIVIGRFGAWLLTQYPDQKTQRIMLAGFGSLLLITAIPFTDYPAFTDQTNYDLARLEQDQQATHTSDTLLGGVLFPVDVHVLPTAINEHFQPVTREQIAGMDIIYIEDTATTTSIYIEIQQPQPVTLDRFYFPGWQLTINDDTKPVRSANDTGLVIFEVSAGAHNVHLQFKSTPARTISVIISVTALLMMVMLSYGLEREAASKHEGDLITSQSETKSAPTIP